MNHHIQNDNGSLNEPKEGKLINKRTTDLSPTYNDERIDALLEAGATPKDLTAYYDQCSQGKKENLIIRAGFGVGGLFGVGGTATLVLGETLIGGLGLLGFGVATIGALFVYITGGQVTMKGFSDSAAVFKPKESNDTDKMGENNV
jgi:hypothetical protein